MSEVQPVQKLAVWIPVTNGMLADALPLGALIEYRLSQPGPLSLQERLTGWRSFTARSGYVLTMRVGWRASLYRLMHPIETWRLNHPPVYEDEDD